MLAYRLEKNTLFSQSLLQDTHFTPFYISLNEIVSNAFIYA